MSPEAQQIAIAEACGWKPHYSNNGFGEHPVYAPQQMIRIPDYLNDLNAMHEAEKVLTRKQVSHYGELLSESANRTYDYPASYLVATATAAQRAEAFLRTLNLWKQ
jgi:hypothetical protein